MQTGLRRAPRRSRARARAGCPRGSSRVPGFARRAAVGEWRRGCARPARASSRPGSRLAPRLAALDARERAIEERERTPVDPDAARLAEIEARLDELRAAEEAFLRTRRELADHSDAITAREQLLAQRERELDEREDGWGGGPDMHELEARAAPPGDPRGARPDAGLQRRVPQARAGGHPPPTGEVVHRFTGSPEDRPPHPPPHPRSLIRA